MASAETSLGKRRNVNSKSAIDSEIVRNSKVGKKRAEKSEKTLVRLSRFRRAPQIYILPDGLTAHGEFGYRSICATHGVSSGVWFYEVRVNPRAPQETTDLMVLCAEPHTRIGFMTDSGDLQAPVGYDRFGYSYRDVDGSVFHQSDGKEYGQPYGPGDVIGCYIRLPKDAPANGKAPDLQLLPQTEIIFFKNGVTTGVAFRHLFEGIYFPACGLYMGASVTFNFGGKGFEFPPPDDMHCQKFCDLPTVLDKVRNVP